MVDAKQKLVEVTRSFSFINIFGEIENVPIHFSRGEHPNCRKNGYKKGHAPMGGALKGRLKGKHCSPTTEFKKGHKTPKAIQEKITKAITGLRKGIPLSEAHCKALSQAKLGKPAPHKAGANCTFWKGGITEKNRAIRMSLEYKNWRRAVFERDDYTCVKCGAKGCTLQADHIKPFSTHPELRFEVSNGRTLCKPCHKRTKTYGRKQARASRSH